MRTSGDARRGLYYGWWIVVAGFICAMVVVGGTNYAFGLYVKPVTEELGLSRATMNMGMTALLLGMAVASPLVGRLLDRFPKPRVILVGAVLFATGFAILSRARTPWVMGLALLLPTAGGVAACGAFASATTVARWFQRNRGRALGFTAVSSSMGGFVMVPLVTWLILHVGWRNALLVQAALVLVVVGLLALFVIRDAPATLPPEEALETSAANAGEERAWPMPVLLRSRNFWLILLSVGLMLAIDSAVLVSLPAYGSDVGFTPSQTAFLMSFLTLSAIAGKASVGFLADKVDKRWLMVAVSVCNFLFVLCLLIKPGYGATFVTCSFIGMAIGGALPVYHALVAEHFGSRFFGSVLGLMTTLTLPLNMAAVPFTGAVFDRTGSYDLAFKVFMVGALLSILLIWLVRRNERDAMLAISRAGVVSAP
jgi:MFS family permease